MPLHAAQSRVAFGPELASRLQPQRSTQPACRGQHAWQKDPCACVLVVRRIGGQLDCLMTWHQVMMTSRSRNLDRDAQEPLDWSSSSNGHHRYTASCFPCVSISHLVQNVILTHKQQQLPTWTVSMDQHKSTTTTNLSSAQKRILNLQRTKPRSTQHFSGSSSRQSLVSIGIQIELSSSASCLVA